MGCEMRPKNKRKKEGVHQIVGGDELKKFFSIDVHQKTKNRVSMLIDLLKSCAKRKDVYTGGQIHADIIKKRLHEKNIILSNSLLNMYVKCGELAKAQEVFNKITNRDVVTWNTLIAGHIQDECSETVLRLFGKMQCAGFSPNVVTYLSVLKACAKMRNLEEGQEIHAAVANEGLLEKSALIGNAVVDMYAKCGQVRKAQEVFDNLPIQNLVSWNSLIGGYSQHGYGENALTSFKEMQIRGLSPDGITLVCALKASSSIRSLEMGQEIHTQIMQGQFLLKDVVVGNALVDMYAKCGKMTKAQEVFDHLPIQDLISWNVLISGYAHCGCSETALNLLEEIQIIGLSPNAVTYISSLQLCASIGALEKGQEIHAWISRKGILARDISLGNALLDMYAKCFAIAKAQDAFDNLSAHNIISWNTLIAMYSEEGFVKESLDCFEQMQLQGFSPNELTFILILKTCGSMGAAHKCHDMHANMMKMGFLNENVAVADVLIEMHMKCGLLWEAQKIFYTLSYRDIVSWNVLLAGYTLYRHGTEKLGFIQKILIDGLCPDSDTFVTLSKFCGSAGAVVEGQEMHTHIVRIGGSEDDSVIGNMLIDMYMNFYMLAEAQQVFDNLIIHETFSWNALISGYLQADHGKEALDCYELMQLGGSFPDTVTRICGARACSIMQDSSKGNEIYSTIIKLEGLMDNDGVCGTALVDMYAKCGCFEEAQELMKCFPSQNVSSWSALIRGCNQRGYYDRALEFFNRMLFVGVFPDSATFVSIMKACGSIRSLQNGQLVHALIVKESLLENDKLLGVAIMDMYVSCGALTKTIEVFDEISRPDLVTWNGLLVGYAHYGYANDVLHCFQQMQLRSISPNTTSFLCSLKACGSCRSVARGKQLHAIASTELIGIDVKSCNSLLDMYIKCGHLVEAERMLDELSMKDLVSWTMLIVGYVEMGHGEQALSCFGQMQQEGILPDMVSFICTLKGCTTTGSVDTGKRIHCQVIIDSLLEEEIIVGNTLVDMYARCGALTRAHEAFGELPIQDVVSWNVLIAGFVQHGHCEEALDFFQRMQLSGVLPDIVTLLSVVRACGRRGTLHKGELVHAQIHMVTDRDSEKDVSVGNTLVDMYAKCGSFARAREMFERLPIQTSIVWNALIAAYAQHEDHHDKALDCFEQMQLGGFAADAVTCMCISKVYGSQGAIGKGQQMHSKVVKQGFSEESDAIGNSILDMYAKWGRMVEAHDTFRRLPKVNVLSWNLLIAGYAQNGHYDEATSCFEQMCHRRFIPDADTYLHALKALAVTGRRNMGNYIQAQMIKDEWLQKDVSLGSVLVDLYAKCGELSKAAEVFHELPIRNSASWNALISGYRHQGHEEEALTVFHEMQLEGVAPDNITFVCILKACGNAGTQAAGQTLHDQITKGGFLEESSVVGSALIDMYSKCGMVDEAKNVFDKLRARGMVSWNALISGYAQQGREDAAFSLFNQFSIRDDEEPPNQAAFIILLNACSNTGLLQEAKWCLEAMDSHYRILPALEHYGCIVDLLGRAGRLAEAAALASQMPFCVTISVWNSVFSACQRPGILDLGRLMFDHVVELDMDHSAAYVSLGNLFATGFRSWDL